MTNTSFGQQPTTPYQSAPSPAAATYSQDPTMTSYPYAPDPYAAPYAAAPIAAPFVADPGRTLGIVGLLASIFFSAVGLFISIVAFRRSKRAGFKNGIALAGIVVGALTTVGIIAASIAAGLGAMHLVQVCSDLGPGEHLVNGVTYTCG